MLKKKFKKKQYILEKCGKPNFFLFNTLRRIITWTRNTTYEDK